MDGEVIHEIQLRAIITDKEIDCSVPKFCTDEIAR